MTDEFEPNSLGEQDKNRLSKIVNNALEIASGGDPKRREEIIEKLKKIIDMEKFREDLQNRKDQ